jgi:hypothetical protein
MGSTLTSSAAPGTAMSRLTLQETRRLKFAVPALLDAALTFDREHNGWLWRASDHALSIDAAQRQSTAADPAVSLAAAPSVAGLAADLG